MRELFLEEKKRDFSFPLALLFSISSLLCLFLRLYKLESPGQPSRIRTNNRSLNLQVVVGGQISCKIMGKVNPVIQVKRTVEGFLLVLSILFNAVDLAVQDFIPNSIHPNQIHARVGPGLGIAEMTPRLGRAPLFIQPRQTNNL